MAGWFGKIASGSNEPYGGIPVKIRRSTFLVGVLAAGLLFTQQACSASDPGAAAAKDPKSDSVQLTGDSAKAGDSAKVGDSAEVGDPAKGEDAGKAPEDTAGDRVSAGSILAGKRQVVIKPNPGSESIVAFDAKGRLSLIDGEAEHALFVLTPSGDKFLITTAKAASGGEPDCVGVKASGSASLTLVATPCDTSRKGQLFTITEQKKVAGRPAYSISVAGAFLQVGPSGLIAEELGDGPVKTTFSFVDNGPASQPVLD